MSSSLVYGLRDDAVYNGFLPMLEAHANSPLYWEAGRLMFDDFVRSCPAHCTSRVQNQLPSLHTGPQRMFRADGVLHYYGVGSQVRGPALVVRYTQGLVERTHVP
jgi:hypothetical protein